MFSNDSLVGARKAAEQAVADMPDGPMKIKAFEVILGRVLPNEPSDQSTPSGGRTSRRTGGERAVKLTQPPEHRGFPKTCGERILSLRQEDFFGEPRGLGEIKDALAVHGWVYQLTSLSGTVQSLVQKRSLRRTLAKVGKKKAYRYVNP